MIDKEEIMDSHTTYLLFIGICLKFTRASQISRKAVENQKRQYLKNWNLKGNTWIQNMGKNTINKLHAIACERSPNPTQATPGVDLLQPTQ